jgi:hypothetical protein
MNFLYSDVFKDRVVCKYFRVVIFGYLKEGGMVYLGVPYRYLGVLLGRVFGGFAIDNNLQPAFHSQFLINIF